MVRIKTDLKRKAILLRKTGKTYSEILSEVFVAKSTLSLWLRDVGLAKKQIQRITEKRVGAQRQGADRVREMRLERESKTIREAKDEVPVLVKNSLWLSGVILYWAEGTKQKVWRVSEKVAFSNMDVATHILMYRWFKEYCNVLVDDFIFELYIHQSVPYARAVSYWAQQLGIKESSIRVYFKKNKINKNYKRNTGESYYGLLRIVIKKSTNLGRRIRGWILGVTDFLRIK